jgi:hypothetical protein
MLYLLRGKPCNAKAKFLDTMLKSGMVRLALDPYEYFLTKEGDFNFDPSKAQDAHFHCLSQVKYLLSEDIDVVVCNEFSKDYTVKRYTDLAKTMNKPYTVLEFKRKVEL